MCWASSVASLHLLLLPFSILSPFFLVQKLAFVGNFHTILASQKGNQKGNFHTILASRKAYFLFMVCQKGTFLTSLKTQPKKRKKHQPTNESHGVDFFVLKKRQPLRPITLRQTLWWLAPTSCGWIEENHLLDQCRPNLEPTADGSEIRQAPAEVGSLSHYLQGFIHPRWCRISSINSKGIQKSCGVVMMVLR